MNLLKVEGTEHKEKLCGPQVYYVVIWIQTIQSREHKPLKLSPFLY